MSDDPRPAHSAHAERRARALARFFADVSSSLLSDLHASGALAGADDAIAEHEWRAVALHACIRGAVSDGGHGDETADLVDAFHDRVIAALAPGDGGATLRAHLAARYDQYDGITRTLGKDRALEVPGAIAAACARHVRASETAALVETLTPLLEALAEGAAASLIESATPSGAERGAAPLIENATPSGAERGAASPADPGGREPSLPPVEAMRRITTRLEAAGIAWAVGGSGLLAALDLVDQVNDWDVQVEADPEALRWLYADLPFTFHGHGGCHADWKLGFEAERTEVIPRFAFFVPGGVVRVALNVSCHWRGLPIAGPEGWACAYWLMGEYDEPSLRPRRSARAELLLGWLRDHGADRARVQEMLAEPLPDVLGARLRALL